MTASPPGGSLTHQPNSISPTNPNSPFRSLRLPPRRQLDDEHQVVGLHLGLVGGVLVEMNGQRYDNTLKNRLKSIHSAMVQGA